jgi:hypothetical protein
MLGTDLPRSHGTDGVNPASSSSWYCDIMDMSHRQWAVDRVALRGQHFQRRFLGSSSAAVDSPYGSRRGIVEETEAVSAKAR